MSESEYQYREQVSPAEFINDYLDFGVYNGTSSIKAYLVYWDLLSDKAKKIRMAKIIAEYGRATEELFVFLYVMSEQAMAKEDVFFERLIYYTPTRLYDFINSTDFTDLCRLLRLENPEFATKRLGLPPDAIRKHLDESITLVCDLRDERNKGFKDVYNKLKHPFLVYSKVPTSINEGLSFGIMQKPELKSQTDIDCVPIIVSKKQALVNLQNVQMIGGVLKFLLRYFQVSYELRANK